MMIGCKEASKLTSKEREVQLTFYEKFKLKFHLMMCGVCKIFHTEIQVIDDAYANSPYHKADLSEESKVKIQTQINLASK